MKKLEKKPKIRMLRKSEIQRMHELSARDWRTLTDAEKEEQSDLFDRYGEVPDSELTEPTPEDRARIERKLGRRPGRPRLGTGAKRVLFTVEPSLLSKVDAYAEAHEISRSELIARALEKEIARK
jgi:hypothetical protein